MPGCVWPTPSAGSAWSPRLLTGVLDSSGMRTELSGEGTQSLLTHHLVPAPHDSRSTRLTSIGKACQVLKISVTSSTLTSQQFLKEWRRDNHLSRD